MPNNPNLITVCPTGCDETDVQDAIDSITDSSASNPYTILIDAVLLSSDTAFTTNAKSYITFAGRGIGASVLQATALWFDNADLGTTDSDFFDISNSTNITFRGLTIDARTQQAPNAGHGAQFSGVRLDDTDQILFDSVRVEGITYAIWEEINSEGNVVKMFNSQVRGVNAALRFERATWFVFSSEIRAVEDPDASGEIGAVNAVQISRGSGATNAVFWGSHLHAESSEASSIKQIQTLVTLLGDGSKVSFIGTTLHAKAIMSTAPAARRITNFYPIVPNGFPVAEVIFVGSDLLYETGDNVTGGDVSAIDMFQSSFSLKIDLLNSSIISRGSGGSRADIVTPNSLGFATIRSYGSLISSAAIPLSFPDGVAAQMDTINSKRGTATFTSVTSVAFTAGLEFPDAAYRVAVTGDTDARYWVTNKTKSGFDIHSSAAGSVTVDWITLR